MSLKAEIVKTALTVAISWEFPEAVVMPVIAGGAMDYFADVYDDSEDKKKQAASEKIDKAYSEIFSKKYFEEQGLDSEKIPYYEAQIKDILQYTPLDLELLSSYKNNTTGLCRFLMEKTWGFGRNMSFLFQIFHYNKNVRNAFCIRIPYVLLFSYEEEASWRKTREMLVRNNSRPS